MYFVVCAFLAIITVGNCSSEDKVLDVLDLSKCGYQIESVGCFQAHRKHLQDQILNSRNKASQVYEEPEIQWKNYNHWLANFICKCATKMLNMKKVDTVFIGIEFYGECWTNLQKNITIKEVKQIPKTTDCVDGDFKQFSSDRLNCQVHTGKKSISFIYKVSRIKNKEKNDCPFFTNRGCFKDTTPRKRSKDKPLPEYIMNERDPSIPNWNNHLIDWKNWGDGYLNEMICRCAKKAKEMKKRFFGIQFYAECWAGDDENKIDQHGFADTCVDDNRATCSTNSTGKCQAKFCAGKDFTNMVYELHQGPLGCLTNPCGADESCIPNGINNHECVKE